MSCERITDLSEKNHKEDQGKKSKHRHFRRLGTNFSFQKELAVLTERRINMTDLT